MRKFTIILIGLFNFTLTTGQTYSSVTSDKEIYDFLNWMTVKDRRNEEEPKLKRKQIYYKILSWDTTNFIITDSSIVNQYQFYSFDGRYLYIEDGGTDTIFKEQDRNFIFKQFTAIKDTIWHDKFSKSRQLTNKKQIKPNRYYYSIPLFSVDKKYVIIHRRYYCGSLCAYGGYYVYKRLDDKNWEYVTEVNSWIS